jgi:hypothetical protein
MGPTGPPIPALPAVQGIRGHLCMLRTGQGLQHRHAAVRRDARGRRNSVSAVWRFDDPRTAHVGGFDGTRLAETNVHRRRVAGWRNRRCGGPTSESRDSRCVLRGSGPMRRCWSGPRRCSWRRRFSRDDRGTTRCREVRTCLVVLQLSPGWEGRVLAGQPDGRDVRSLLPVFIVPGLTIV